MMTQLNSPRPKRPSTSFTSPFNRQKLAREAAARALKVRHRLRVGLYEPVSPFDIAQRLGVDVRFENLPSMEGMYCQMQGRPPLIVLASERPAGRQNFTCGHELGHYEFGHGARLDELLDDAARQSLSPNATQLRQADPEEFLADCFAGFLLMPKSTVDRAFARRGIQPATAEPLEIYNLACYLGVGYRTLVEHLCFSLGSITRARVDDLRVWATRLPKLRAAIAGQAVRHIVVVDEAWETRPVDLLTDDVLLLPAGWGFDGDTLATLGLAPPLAWRSGVLVQAIKQGMGSLCTPERRELPVRVSRRGFAGLARHRHLDDPDEGLDEGDGL